MNDLRNVVDGWPERVVPEDLGTTYHGGEHLARYLFAAHWAAGQRVADLCCGVGYGTNLLRASGARSALGIDVSEGAVEEARRRYGGCEFAVADLTQPFDLSDYGVRVCFEAIEHVQDPHALLRTLAAALPPDGVALVSTPNGDSSGQSANPHHVREYGSDEFRALLEQHFRSVQMFFQWHYPNPFDTTLTMRNLVRALVPTTIKHRLKRQSATQSAPESSVPNGAAANCRPLRQSYLSVLPPGFRYRPSMWVAVCSDAGPT